MDKKDDTFHTCPACWTSNAPNIDRQIPPPIGSHRSELCPLKLAWRTPVCDATNPKDAIGASKPDLSLVPPAATIYTALAMQDGAYRPRPGLPNGYGPYNWRKTKVRARVYVAAACRHILAWLDGEEKADDSGVPHLGHALASLGILVDALETENLIDDRPVKGAATRLLAAREKPAWVGVERELPMRESASECEKAKARRRQDSQLEYPCPYKCPGYYAASTESLNEHINEFHKNLSGGASVMPRHKPHRWVR